MAGYSASNSDQTSAYFGPVTTSGPTITFSAPSTLTQSTGLSQSALYVVGGVLAVGLLAWAVKEFRGAK